MGMNEENDSARADTASDEHSQSTYLEVLTSRIAPLINTGFDRELVLRLRQVDGVDEISRVETELRILDLFAVYLAIKLSGSPEIDTVRAALSERVCVEVLSSWAPAWDTHDDVVEVWKGRFSAYNHVAEGVDFADPHDRPPLIGLFAALLIQSDKTLFSDERCAARKAAVDAVGRLTDSDNLIWMTATQVFKTRFDAVSALLSEFPTKQPADSD